MKKLLLTALTVTALTAGAMNANAQDESAQDESTYDHTVTVINNDAAEIGTIGLTQGSAGVLMNVDLSGLPAGKHGFHLHHTGDCSDHEAFKASGGHIAGEGTVHGLLNPEGPEAGDLPNLIVDENGDVETELHVWGMVIEGDGGTNVLADEDGSAFVIHEDADDHMTQPIGGAGARIACGTIEGVAAMDADTGMEGDLESGAETETEAETEVESKSEAAPESESGTPAEE